MLVSGKTTGEAQDIIRGEFGDERNPWAELFSLFKEMNYQRFTPAEIQGRSDPIRVMNYHRAL